MTVPRDRTFTLGRSEEADLPIPDSKISRIHCAVEFRGDGWVLEDLDSRNGTWIGSARVKKHTLADGDVFLLGRSSAVKATLRAADPPATGRPGPGRRVVFHGPSRPAPVRPEVPDPVPAPMAEVLPPLEGAMVGIPGTTLGEFRIVEQAAPLGHATFFRALQPSLNRHVLVEVFTEEEMSRGGGRAALEAEVRKAARLLHPNILQIFDYGAARGFTYVTMEYFQGRNLNRILAEKGFVPIGQALGLFRQICEVFATAIDHGVGAGAVTPADIWVNAEFTPKVKFFREPGSPEPAPVLAAYQAPEVHAGGDPSDPRAAVYAAGALLYHMLAATPPLSGATREEIVRRARHDTPTPLRRVNIKVSALLARTVEQSLAKDPARRPETLGEFAREVHRSTAPTI